MGSSIEIEDVEPGRAHGLPFERHVKRIVREDSLFLVIALKEADTSSVSDVNRRYYFDFYLTRNK